MTFFEYRDWTAARRERSLVSTRLNIQGDLRAHLSGSGCRRADALRAGVLLVLLVVVGGLFLVIEGVALVVGFALARSITGSVHELFAGTERVRQGDFTHKIAHHGQRSARGAGRHRSTR